MNLEDFVPSSKVMMLKRKISLCTRVYADLHHLLKHRALFIYVKAVSPPSSQLHSKAWNQMPQYIKLLGNSRVEITLCN